MMKYSILNTLAACLSLLVLIGCHKDVQLEVKEPKVTEQSVFPQTTSATFRWEVDYPWEYEPSVLLSLKQDMSDAVSYGFGVKYWESSTLLLTVDNLEKGTTYYYCYQVVNPGMKFNSQVKEFNTKPTLKPTITTAEITDVSRTCATAGGNVINDGNDEVTERGVCWGTTSNPDTGSGFSHLAAASSGMGSFTVSLTDLEMGTAYYVRAYAVNSTGTSYGEEVSFTTKVLGKPEVTTFVTSIFSTSAIGGGEVIDDGGFEVTERGICWSTSHNPVITDNHATCGVGMGGFSGAITGLTANTNYYVKAYATNSMGTNYGSEVSFTTTPEPSYPTGAINSLFTINDKGDKVCFSQGNLQYVGSSSTWRFADNQWDVIGDAQANFNQNTTRDLFGWGTSGWNSGAVCYQPWSFGYASNYYPGGVSTNNLTGNYAKADWGVYNPISNGGNQAGLWRTLTNDEWRYVIETRSTMFNVRYAKACVNNVNGVILLPDDWNPSTFSLSTDNGGDDFNSNTITDSQWIALEQYGAVFLPAAGDCCRSLNGNSLLLLHVGLIGHYWSSTGIEDNEFNSYSDGSAYHVYISQSGFYPTDYERSMGASVRLVHCLGQ